MSRTAAGHCMRNWGRFPPWFKAEHRTAVNCLLFSPVIFDCGKIVSLLMPVCKADLN